MTDINAFVERYIAIWNEPNAERRREIVRALWQEDATHLSRTIEAIGHTGIESRVANAYEKWVKEKGNISGYETAWTAIMAPSSCAGRCCRPVAAT